MFGNDVHVTKGFKHVFTSPSSVNGKPKGTRSGNARIHGMRQVTPASIAYIAMQVGSLSSSSSLSSGRLIAAAVGAIRALFNNNVHALGPSHGF